MGWVIFLVHVPHWPLAFLQTYRLFIKQFDASATKGREPIESQISRWWINMPEAMRYQEFQITGIVWQVIDTSNLDIQMTSSIIQNDLRHWVT